MGIHKLNFLNENKFFSAILPELDLSNDKRIDEIAQEIQKEAILLEQMLPHLQAEYGITADMGMMSIGDQMVYTQNIFFDHTMKNEGGFYATAYSPTNEWNIINSKINPDYIKYDYFVYRIRWAIIVPYIMQAVSSEEKNTLGYNREKGL